MQHLNSLLSNQLSITGNTHARYCSIHGLHNLFHNDSHHFKQANSDKYRVGDCRNKTVQFAF